MIEIFFLSNMQIIGLRIDYILEILSSRIFVFTQVPISYYTTSINAVPALLGGLTSAVMAAIAEENDGEFANKLCPHYPPLVATFLELLLLFRALFLPHAKAFVTPFAECDSRLQESGYEWRGMDTGQSCLITMYPR